jgi:cytochrome c-type biogenesis protein CcmH
MLANGVVGEPARKAYEKLRTLKPDAVEPKVWLAIAKEQDGDLAGAAADYKALLAGAGADEPWHGLLEGRLKSVEARLGETPPAAVPSTDSKEGKETPAAETAGKPNLHTMTPEQRQAFIEQMVSGLAARLKTNGKDLRGWMQLVRSYVVLGRSEDATAALTEARKNFAGDEKALAQLQALAQVLGIGS